MLDDLKADLVSQYRDFVLEFSDLKGVDRSKIEEKIKCKIADVFAGQKTSDFAKRVLKKDMRIVLALYLDRFQTRDGFNAQSLLSSLERDRLWLPRHLKKDAVRYVRLLAQTMSKIDARPKGLLAS